MLLAVVFRYFIIIIDLKIVVAWVDCLNVSFVLGEALAVWNIPKLDYAVPFPHYQKYCPLRSFGRLCKMLLQSKKNKEKLQ